MDSDILSKENVFESKFVPKHHYPHWIRLYNLFSFEYINKQVSQNSFALFSITRMRGESSLFSRRCKVKYVATYNIYYQYYSFDNKKFVTYDDLLIYVWNFK